MPHFADLRHELESYLNEDVIEKVHKAYRFAAHAHKGQQRRSGDPYIVHPLAVAQILAEMRMDPQTILAAILHDVIEDTSVEKEGLIREFGEEVAELVDGVSKLAQIEFQDRLEAQAENFRKMLLAMAKDIRVILIKLADRLHNMRTLTALPSAKQCRIARETLEIYAPISQRLGMHDFRIEFEELCFAALYPLRYRVLQAAVKTERHARKKNITHIETAIKERLEKNKLPPSAVWVYQKHLFGIYKEMREKKRSLAEIMDINTFCITTDSEDSCYRALGAIHSLYKPLPERIRDYIALPKANGYQALHTTLFGPYGVPLEIQIRTVLMDNMADSGITTHWLQTSEPTNPAHLRARQWLGRLLDIQQSTGNALEFIENVKIDLFPEEVYVFTPQGEILELPRGATPIDFAYAIHSDIGNSAVAARIDRRIAPLSTMLSNGQTVEIITEPNARPHPAWLNFAVTGRARSKVRQYLKSQHRNESIAFGKRLLDSAITALDVNWSDLTSESMAAITLHFQYKNTDDLFEAIGLGNQMVQQIMHYLQNVMGFSAKKTDTAPQLMQSLVIKGTEGMLVNFAECCRPIPGDPVTGQLTAGRGIIIHRDNCKQTLRFAKHPEKIISVFWGEKIQGNFKVDIRAEVNNQPGVLAKLAGDIARSNANIDNVSVEQRDGNYCVVHLTLSIHDRTHLAHVIKNLRRNKTLIRVVRGK